MLRWGILATGGIAASFASDLRTAGLDLVAVGSRSQDSADAFAARFDIARAHGSAEALVADPEVDIVYIASPHPMHRDGALLALNAGKHVLIEKSITVNEAQAREIAELAEAKGLLAMEAMWTRYLPHMVRIREIIAAGTLGEVRSLQADHTQSLPLDPAHRINALELGGGALLDLGIYPISFAWDILGEPTTVQAVGRIIETGADSEVATVMTHPGGTVSSTLSSSRSRGRNEATIIGDKARIEIDAVWYTPASFRVVAPNGDVLEDYESQVEGRGMQYQALAAEEIIASGRRDSELLPIAESVAIMGTLDEIRRQIGVAYPSES